MIGRPFASAASKSPRMISSFRCFTRTHRFAAPACEDGYRLRIYIPYGRIGFRILCAGWRAPANLAFFVATFCALSGQSYVATTACGNCYAVAQRNQHRKQLFRGINSRLNSCTPRVYLSSGSAGRALFRTKRVVGHEQSARFSLAMPLAMRRVLMLVDVVENEINFPGVFFTKSSAFHLNLDAFVTPACGNTLRALRIFGIAIGVENCPSARPRVPAKWSSSYREPFQKFGSPLKHVQQCQQSAPPRSNNRHAIFGSVLFDLLYNSSRFCSKS